MARPQISIRKLLMRQNAHVAIGFGLVFLIGYLIAYAINISDVRELEAHGVDTQATVQRTFTVRRTDHEGRRQTQHRVEYSFELPDGERRLDTASVSPGYYRSVSVGDRVDLRYLPDDPGTAELDLGYHRGGTTLIGFIGLGFAAAIGGYGWWLWRRTSAVLRAVRQGEKRSARVLGLIHSKAYQNDKPLMQLHWIDSANHEGSSLRYFEDTLAPWPKGSEITVYADPKTGQTFWEEDLKA